MNSPYLMQTGIVEKLLNAVTSILPDLSEGESKRSLIEAMDNFKHAITPSTIFLSEIDEHLATHSLKISREEAIQLLESAAYDIDLNYVADALADNVDQYLSEEISFK